MVLTLFLSSYMDKSVLSKKIHCHCRKHFNIFFCPSSSFLCQVKRKIFMLWIWDLIQSWPKLHMEPHSCCGSESTWALHRLKQTDHRLLKAYLSLMVLGKMNRFQPTESCKKRCELNLTLYDSNRWQDKMWKAHCWTKLSKKNPREEHVLMLAWSTFSISHFLKRKKGINIKSSWTSWCVLTWQTLCN